jgi:serine/threonine-protein kinase HipA
MSALDVFLHAERVGRVERLPGAELRFAYRPASATAGTPLSLRLPRRAEPFADRECRPFFLGLIPEGDFLTAIARAFRVAAENPFAILAEIGGECAGAVSLVAEGAAPPQLSAPPPRRLDSAQLANLLTELPSRPLLVGEDGEGVRLSLAGTTDKLPVLWDGESIGITRGRPPSTHIVKTPIRGVLEMVANEAYCLSLAAAAGIVAAEAKPLAMGGHEALLVRRFDRREDADGEVHRVHQEDICQALGFVPAEKYEADGGPGVAACVALLRERSAAPAVDLLAFLDALLFNLAIGNCDAHAKNYSLLLEGEESPRLAPLYDLLSTRVYPELRNRKMAMKYGGEYRADRIRGRHLDRLAADFEIAPRAVRGRTAEFVERLNAARGTARDGLPEPWRSAALLDRIDVLIDDSTAMLHRALAEND